jgi:hypothetical protein
MCNVKREGFQSKNQLKCKQTGLFFRGRFSQVFKLLHCIFLDVGLPNVFLATLFIGLQTTLVKATFVMLLLKDHLHH